MGAEDDFPRTAPKRPTDPFQQQLHGERAHGVGRLRQGCQKRVDLGRVRDIIEADEGHILRDPTSRVCAAIVERRWP